MSLHSKPSIQPSIRPQSGLNPPSIRPQFGLDPAVNPLLFALEDGGGGGGPRAHGVDVGDVAGGRDRDGAEEEGEGEGEGEGGREEEGKEGERGAFSSRFGKSERAIERRPAIRAIKIKP